MITTMKIRYPGPKIEDARAIAAGRSRCGWFPQAHAEAARI